MRPFLEFQLRQVPHEEVEGALKHDSDVFVHRG